MLNIFKWGVSLFRKQKNPPLGYHEVERAVRFVNLLKEGAKLLQIAALFTANRIDDVAVAKAKKVLYEVSRGLGRLNSAVPPVDRDGDGDIDITDLLVGIREHAYSLEGWQRSAFWYGLSAKVAEVASDGRVTLREAFLIGQYVYETLYEQERKG